MIKIYCLINPMTGLPMYVGSTKHKLLSRLSRHIWDARTASKPDDTFYYKKHLAFKMISEQGLKPKILLLFITNVENTDICEKYFYNLFTSQGVDLLQTNYNFVYNKKFNKKISSN